MVMLLNNVVRVTILVSYLNISFELIWPSLVLAIEISSALTKTPTVFPLIKYQISNSAVVQEK